VGPHPKMPPSEKSVDQAAAWFACRRSGSWSSEDDSEFATWLKADPSHTAAWSAFERLWRRVDTVRDDPKILAIRERARRNAARGQWLQWTWRVAGAVAASLVVGILAWRNDSPSVVPFAHPPAVAPVPASALVRDASTEIGERSFLVLPDGSKVTLNTASAVHADFTGQERRVTLVRGEAYFNVAKDPTRPFIVSAGPRQIIAVGTAFDVRLQDRQMKVTLVEGKVRVVRTLDQVQHRTAVMLEAGSALVASEDGVDHVERLDTARVTSWRSGKLVFDGERLADVVAEMNRYSREKLEIADPALEERKVSGVFEPTNVSAFAKAIESYGIARITEQTATTIVLESPK
jgi:transmembrane sensor